MSNFQYDILILGAGPGGIEAALQAAKARLKVALISNAKIGGRATFGSLVPSKVWLTAAEKMDTFRHVEDFALKTTTPTFEIKHLGQKIQQQSGAASDRYQLALQQAGVEIIHGKGWIVEQNLVHIKDEQEQIIKGLTTRYIMIATGSEPRFLPELKPNGQRIIAPRLAAGLKELPKNLIMAGGGVTGTEYAYALAALGAQVTILQNSEHLLPRVDTEISEAFAKYLTQHYNIIIQKSDPVALMHQEGERVIAATVSGKKYEADYGFIAIGRSPDLSFFDPEKYPIKLEGKAIAINNRCQTSIPNIYAIGDATGVPMMANRSTMQARVAVRHIAQGEKSDLFVSPIIEAVYTQPQVAQIGDMTASGRSDFIVKPMNNLLKTNLLGKASGLLKIKVNKASNRIEGAAGFGIYMTEILSAIQVAMNAGLPYDSLSTIPLAHPSLAELLTIY